MLTLAHRAMLGAASRPKPPVSLFTLAGASTSSDIATGTLLDASGNRIVVGYYGSPPAGFVAKLDPDGALLWQRKLSLGVRCFANAGIVNSSGDIYVSGAGRASGTVDSSYIAKYNSSGALQWQRKLTSAVSSSLSSLAIDASGGVYALGSISGTQATALLVKYSAGGAIQWQRVVSHASNSLNGARGLSIDASGNLYFGVEHTISAGSNSWNLVIKCNGSGVVQNCFGLRIGTTNNQVYGTALDASGNIYVSGETTTWGTPVVRRPFVCKLNSSGALQWHRYLTGDENLQALSALTLSSDGVHVYAAGAKYLFKFLSSDGSLVWQRSLTGPGSTTSGDRMAHASGFLYTASALSSMPSTGMDALAAKLPDDGSGTGTYGSVIVYSESALTSNVGSPSTDTPTITDAAGSLTEAAGDMTDAAGTLTITPYL